MGLVKPSLYEVSPFPASDKFLFKFDYTGSDQAVKNNLQILKTSDNTVVYDANISTLSFQHTLPASTLVNGTEYKARVRVANSSGAWSAFSDWIIVWALSEPTVTIDSIDSQGRVYNQTVTFESTYSQAEGELLESYRYLLYDSDKNLIKSYDEQFNDGSTKLTQEISDLENGSLYHIEVITLSVNGDDGTSGILSFTPFYEAPTLSATLNVENDGKRGSIKISSQIVQIIGQVDSGTISYVNGEWIDLTTGQQISFQEGFNTSKSDLILKLWCKDIPDNTVFLRLIANEGYIELTKYDSKIHAFKYINNSNIKPHFASNAFTVSSGQTYMVYMKQINGAIDLTATAM